MSVIIDGFKREYRNGEVTKDGMSIYLDEAGAYGRMEGERIMVIMGDDAIVGDTPWMVTQLDDAGDLIGIYIPMLIQFKTAEYLDSLNRPPLDEYTNDGQSLSRLMYAIKRSKSIPYTDNVDGASKASYSARAQKVSGVGVSLYMCMDRMFRERGNSNFSAKKYLKGHVDYMTRDGLLTVSMIQDIEEILSQPAPKDPLGNLRRRNGIQ